MAHLFQSFLLGVVLVGALAHANNVETEVDSILATIENNYAPLRLKRDTVGMDWSGERSTIRARLTKAKDTVSFYRELSKVFGSFQDAHISIQIPSNYQQTLPIAFSYTEGGTLVSYAEESLGKEAFDQIEIGDELIEIDGQSPQELREQMNPYFGIGDSRANRSLMTLYLTQRSEKRGLPLGIMKSKKSLIVLRRQGTTDHYTIEAEWKVSGVPIINRKLQPPTPTNRWESEEELGEATKLVRQVFQFQKQLADTTISVEQPVVSANAKTKGTKFKLGHTKPFFPLPRGFRELKAPGLVGTLVANTGLYAGTFKHEGKKVGFIRIPHYVPAMPELSIFGLRYVIGKLEQSTDYLVIDQTNNPGGYVLYSDFVVSSLVGKLNHNHMKFAVRPTQSFLRMFAEAIDTVEKQKLIPKEVKEEYLPRLKREYEKVEKAYQQHDFLSQPVSLAVFSQFAEAVIDSLFNNLLGERFKDTWEKVRRVLKFIVGVDITKSQQYTKPVYMIINNLAFSGGDATAANLKDYERVTLIGGTTAGAGGSVVAFRNDVSNPFTFRLTNSLMVRSGSTRYVENYGVRPHYPLEVRATDYADGFKNYLERVLSFASN